MLAIAGVSASSDSLASREPFRQFLACPRGELAKPKDERSEKGAQLLLLERSALRAGAWLEKAIYETAHSQILEQITERHFQARCQQLYKTQTWFLLSILNKRNG